MTKTIHQIFSEQFPDQTIASINQVSESRYHTVWKVTTNDHIFAVKHHLFANLTRGKPYDLLNVEQRVNAHLSEDGVSTPSIITTAPEHSLVIYEWWGEHTLDDICQTTNPAPFTDNIIKTICTLEKSFHNHTQELAPHVAPGCALEDLQTSWHETIQPLCEILPDLTAYITGKPAPSNLLAQWADLINNHANATLGPTDYNARNIVFSKTDKPAILELAKIGWDWPERRLVQYTTSLGAHHPTGHIVSLLTPSCALDYANATALVYHTPPETILARLDKHHLIFHLIALHTCLIALSTPDHPWKNIEARLTQHTNQIVQGLSNHPPILAFRQHFQTE